MYMYKSVEAALSSPPPLPDVQKKEEETMRLSCNGCRVLRKGCSDSCSIRPCLQWIKSPDAQSNATVFLAKFYGRAGLLNLINAAGPEHLRPAVFRSLLYEACGRIVNPIYGSVGLLWSGNWHMCQAAVEAVLKGAPIVRISDDLIAASPTPAHLLSKAYDIRHVSGDNKKKRASASSAAAAACRNNKKPKHQQDNDQVSAVSDHNHMPVESDDAEAGSHVSQAEHNQHDQVSVEDEQEAAEEEQHLLGLDLTLGFAPVPAPPPAPTAGDASCGLPGTGSDAEPGFVGLRFL